MRRNSISQMSLLAAPSPANPSGGATPADPLTGANLPRSFNGRFGTGNWRPAAPAADSDNSGAQTSRDPKKNRSDVPDVPPATAASFDIPGSYFGRLLTGTAHLVPDNLPPSAQEASLPLVLSGPSISDQQRSFDNGRSTSAQARAPQADPHFRQLSSPILPLGWSPSPPVARDQAQPQPDAASGDDLHEWFARWIRSFDR